MAAELILVGVGHVFDIGKKIENIIEKELPDAVAVELDKIRVAALQSKDITKIKNKNFLYSLLARVQEVIAKKFNGHAGNEMLVAINTSNKIGVPVFYIDMESKIMINKLWNILSIRERISLLFSIFLSIFVRKEKIEKEIRSFEDNSMEFLKKIEESFPKLKHILIDERNEYMSEKLKKLSDIHHKIVAIVGEGHILGLSGLLECEEIDLRIIHLSQLL